MHGNNLGISINQHTKQYSKGEQLSPSAFAISRIPTCQKVSLWTKTEGVWAFLFLRNRYWTDYDFKELIYAVGVIPVFARNTFENCDDDEKPQEKAISVKELFGIKESKNFALFIL